MKTNLIKFYFTKWYVPVLFAILAGTVCYFLVSIRYKYTLEVALLIPFLAVLASLFLGLRRLFQKDYFNGVLQLAGTIVVGFIGLYMATIICWFYPYDFFGTDHQIPEGLKYSIPIEEIKNVPANLNEIVLFNAGQPGIYTYSANVKNLPKGSVYLKAFEVTENVPLSTDNLKEKSEIKIAEPIGDSVMRLSLPIQQDFTIYEGDWGDPYAARFELWFKSVEGKKRKLSEKVFKIEGWQR